MSDFAHDQRLGIYLTNTLEEVAKHDRNRKGPYCCIFGIAIDRGNRQIKREQKTRRAHSDNTEVWLSDYFWPFFANYSYEEMMAFVLQVLLSTSKADSLATQIDVPDRLLDTFGEACTDEHLIDDSGNFDDPYKLVHFFCSKPSRKSGEMRS